MEPEERAYQKLLYQTIKNSLVETTNINSGLGDIEEMPVFYPTEEEFRNPIDYVDQLYYKEEVHKYGCVKVIPPASFKPKNLFDMKASTPLPTRYQTLKKLT